MHSIFIMSASVPSHFVVSLHAISKTNPIQASINYIFTVCAVLPTLACYTLYSWECTNKRYTFFLKIYRVLRYIARHCEFVGSATHASACYIHCQNV